MIIIIGVLILLVLIYSIAVTLKVYNSAYELTHPVKSKYYNDIKVSYAYRKFEFITRDGVKLVGIDYQPKTNCKGTILVCHFLGGSKEGILLFVDSLLNNGYRILSFDNRNHGESETCKGVKASLEIDFAAFYEKVKEMGIEGPFGIMGFSMGASQAICALHEYSDIQAAVTDSGPMLDVKGYFNYVLDLKKIKSPIHRSLFLFIFLHYARFSRMAENTVIALKEQKAKPILMIHGERDNIISVDNAKRAFELLESDQASIWCVPRSRHLTNKYLKTEEYDERIVKFFNKNIAKKTDNEKNSVNFS